MFTEEQQQAVDQLECISNTHGLHGLLRFLDYVVSSHIPLAKDTNDIIYEQHLITVSRLLREARTTHQSYMIDLYDRFAVRCKQLGDTEGVELYLKLKQAMEGA